MKEYPTDEELELFIEQLEQQELYAPRHMKEQILSRAFPEQTAEALPKSGGGKSTVQLFSYRLKIIAGMAAALLMLVLLPIEGELRESREGFGEGFGGSFAEKSFSETEEWENSLQESWKEDEEEKNAPDVNNMLNGGVRRAGERLNAWIDRLDHIQLGSFFEK